MRLLYCVISLAAAGPRRSVQMCRPKSLWVPVRLSAARGRERLERVIAFYANFHCNLRLTSIRRIPREKEMQPGFRSVAAKRPLSAFLRLAMMGCPQCAPVLGRDRGGSSSARPRAWWGACGAGARSSFIFAIGTRCAALAASGGVVSPSPTGAVPIPH